METLMNMKRHRLSLRVRADEVVGDWHVHYSVYLHYLEEAANDHLAALGFALPKLMEDYHGVLVVRHLEIDYQGLARAGDDLAITTWVESAGGVRVVRRTEIHRATTDQLLIAARVLWVWVDANQRPRRLPRELVEALQPTEGPVGAGHAV